MIGFIVLQDGVEDGGNSVQFIKRDASGGSPEDGVGVNSPALELLLNCAGIEIYDSTQLAEGVKPHGIRRGR
jgi:hypothetical protein